MTTEDDFHRLLDADPSDWQTRLIFADWLEERGDPRAEGYRVMGRLRLQPQVGCNPSSPNFFGLWYWRSTDTGRSFKGVLRTCWWNKIPKNEVDGRYHVAYRSRRESEDAAALAFAELDASRKQIVLS